MPNRADPSMSEPSPAAVLRRRAEAIAQVRMQIARYGLTYADLVAAGCFPSRKRTVQKIRYRSADGQTWDGEGDMPDWLQRAVNAGQSPEHFRVGA
ncbi:H-NS family nucleoid-associated regulatory protein [Ralstonia solanacearum]|uniref:H-NS histone family protein n=1 Tax=Ralstonia solanacearum species complex TaxID=3116862 RepID=UPI0018D1B9B0|nr:H-NS family nucleoid-associated regulatory protein [Ralstonia solanacearum]